MSVLLIVIDSPDTRKAPLGLLLPGCLTSKNRGRGGMLIVEFGTMLTKSRLFL